jgi:hypothetical protein
MCVPCHLILSTTDPPPACTRLASRPNSDTLWRHARSSRSRNARRQRSVRASRRRCACTRTSRPSISSSLSTPSLSSPTIRLTRRARDRTSPRTTCCSSLRRVATCLTRLVCGICLTVSNECVSRRLAIAAPDVGLAEEDAHLYFRQIVDGMVRPRAASQSTPLSSSNRRISTARASATAT